MTKQKIQVKFARTKDIKNGVQAQVVSTDDEWFSKKVDTEEQAQNEIRGINKGDEIFIEFKQSGRWKNWTSWEPADSDAGGGAPEEEIVEEGIDKNKEREVYEQHGRKGRMRECLLDAQTVMTERFGNPDEMKDVVKASFLEATQRVGVTFYLEKR
jgi:hypothetical protein